MKAHIQYLLDKEQSSDARLMWGRMNDTTIWISTLGYRHMEQNEIEENLLKLGCRYEFSKPLQHFDKLSGRTYTYFKEVA